MILLLEKRKYSKTKFKNNIKAKDIFPENFKDYNFFERKNIGKTLKKK